MRAIADSAEPVERGNAKGAGEISVGAAAHGAFAQAKTHLPCEGLRALEKCRAHFALERRTIEPASDVEASPFVNRAKSMEAVFECAHVGSFQGAQIENGAGTFCNDVGASATLYDVGVDAHAAAGIVPLFDARELCSQFIDGVDPFFGRQARVGSAPMDNQFGRTDAFACGLQQAARSEGRFQNENSVAAAGFRFD